MGRLSEGDKFNQFSASEWNEVRARSFRQSSHDYSQTTSPASASALDGIVQVINQTGQYLEPGFVVGLSEPTILPINSASADEFRNTMNFKGVVPTEEYVGRFGICLDGCEPGAIIPAVIWGPAWAQIRMESADDRFCDIHPETAAKLRSGMTGSAQIVYHFPNGAAYPQDTYAYIRIGNVPGKLRGVVATSITHASPGTVKLVRKTSTGYAWQRDAEEEIVVVTAGGYSLNSSESIEAETAVYLDGFADGTLEATSGNCTVRDWELEDEEDEE